MSAYSEWKNGQITDAEYASACREEEYLDKYFEEETESEDYFIDDEIDEF